MSDLVRVFADVPAKIKQELKIFTAQKRGRTQQEVVGQAIQEYIKKHKKEK